MKELQLDWKHILTTASYGIRILLDQHKAIFEDGIRTVKTNCAKLQCAGREPQNSERHVLNYLLSKTKSERSLTSLATSTMERVSYREWAALLWQHPRWKVCSESEAIIKLLVNSVMDIDQYPLP